MSDGYAIRAALGSTLRARRVAAGLTLAALADKAELSAAHISDVERGVKDLSSDRLAMACAALQVAPAALFAEMSVALGGAASQVPGAAPRVRLLQNAERLSPGALRTVAEFSAYMASKETGNRRRKIGFEF